MFVRMVDGSLVNLRYAHRIRKMTDLQHKYSVNVVGNGLVLYQGTEEECDSYFDKLETALVEANYAIKI